MSRPDVEIRPDVGEKQKVVIHSHGEATAFGMIVTMMKTGFSYSFRIDTANIEVEVTSIHDDPNHHDGYGRYVYARVIDGDADQFAAEYQKQINASE